MAVVARSPSRQRRGILLALKVAALVVEVAALAYVAWNLALRAWPLVEASAAYAQESTMTGGPTAVLHAHVARERDDAPPGGG